MPGSTPHRNGSGKQSGAPAASWSQGQYGGRDLVGCCRGDTAAGLWRTPPGSLFRPFGSLCASWDTPTSHRSSPSSALRRPPGPIAPREPLLDKASGDAPCPPLPGPVSRWARGPGGAQAHGNGRKERPLPAPPRHRTGTAPPGRDPPGRVWVSGAGSGCGSLSSLAGLAPGCLWDSQGREGAEERQSRGAPVHESPVHGTDGDEQPPPAPQRCSTPRAFRANEHGTAGGVAANTGAVWERPSRCSLPGPYG